MAKFTPQAVQILEQRYLSKNKEGNVIETPDQMLERVAKHISKNEKNAAKWEKKFLDIMDPLEFLPNSPTLMNAGKELGQLSACVSGDTIIRTCSGDFTIKELSEKYEKNERFDVYSYSSKDHKIVIGKAFNPRKTRSNAKTYKITFDDGSYLKATEDHLIMKRDKGYCRVDELVVGQSVMPFNYFYNNGYLGFYLKIDTHPVMAHKFVYTSLNKDNIRKEEVIHHKNYIKTDNRIDNLQKMVKQEHFMWHSQHMKEFNPMYKEAAKQKISERMKFSNPMKNKEISTKVGIKNKISLLGNTNAKKVEREKRKCILCDAEFACKITSIKQFCSKKCAAINNSGFRKGCGKGNLNVNFGSGKFVGTPAWAMKASYNHKVVSIEFAGYEDVYDLSVEKYHNFVANNIFVHNCFVLPVEDDLAAIFEVVKESALIHKTGGGTGFNFSKLRPRNSIVNSTSGVASGPVSFMYAFDAVTETVKQGGVRRGANLGLLNINHPDIIEFINCKQDITKYTNFNISVGLTGKFLDLVKSGKAHLLINPSNRSDRKSLDSGDLFTLLCNNIWSTGEPGIIFLDHVNNLNPIPWMGRIETTNPCLAGDTLIAVADGRNAVSISELAEEGCDVPVFCRNDKGEVSIRMMRNPRISGKKDIYKIVLSNGESVKTTGNHKFVLSDGSIKNADELVFGDSLSILNKRVAKYNTIIKHGNSVSQNYYWLNTSNDAKYQLEHRLIATFYNDNLGYKNIVHHKDRNGLNNKISNLEIMTEQEHDALHSLGMIGDNNPMRRFPEKNWMNNPEKQLQHRIKHHVGAKRSDIIKAKIGKASRERLKNPDFRLRHSTNTKNGMLKNKANFDDAIKNRALVKLKECQDKTDLKCFLQGNSVFVEKICEKCGKVFQIPWNKREVGYCSIQCFNSRNRHKESLPVFSNHTVVSIERLGEEVVYNGTVDEYHNYFIGHFEESIEGDKCFTYINTLQCGEQPLLPWESCNLGSINVSKFVSSDGEIKWQKLFNTVETAVRFLDNVIDANKYPRVKISRKTLATRKIGLGIMGWADLLLALKIKYDSEEALKLADDLMSKIQVTAHSCSEELGKEKGLFPANNGILKRRNATLTTIAPTGTLSMIADCSSSIEPVFAKNFTKTVLNNVTLNISEKYRKYSNEDYFTTALEISPEWHVKMQAAFQKNIDNAVSKTINLPHEANIEDVKKAVFLAHDLGCKGITMYRQDTREAPIQVISKELSECEGGKCTL